ncbi:DapH/DapD/GlmU-related protein [uncultured Alcanivorax sp.]|uniref:acyltransferase n=1 Tax=uncultured Alcanivorax sp. TaxID=191215 RepID=UPI002616C43C|nr:DapH/DapD/GlmU-related protein [uncultured Alcanivorax sp.]
MKNHFFYFVLTFLSASIFYQKPFLKVRSYVIRKTGVGLGVGVNIRPGHIFWPQKSMKNLKIGSGTFANFNFRVEMGTANVTIGEFCQIGPNVSVECVSHGLIYREAVGRGSASSDVKIGDKVWIGSNVTILGGVTIGDRAVIGSGSIVTKDVEADAIYFGVPAKKHCSIDDSYL